MRRGPAPPDRRSGPGEPAPGYLVRSCFHSFEPGIVTEPDFWTLRPESSETLGVAFSKKEEIPVRRNEDLLRCSAERLVGENRVQRAAGFVELLDRLRPLVVG